MTLAASFYVINLPTIVLESQRAVVVRWFKTIENEDRLHPAVKKRRRVRLRVLYPGLRDCAHSDAAVAVGEHEWRMYCWGRIRTSSGPADGRVGTA